MHTLATSGVSLAVNYEDAVDNVEFGYYGTGDGNGFGEGEGITEDTKSCGYLKDNGNGVTFEMLCD